MCLRRHALTLPLPSLHIPRQVLLQVGHKKATASLRRSDVILVTNLHCPG